MAWAVELEAGVLRSLKKMDFAEAKRILLFLKDRVATLENPRSLGEALRGPRLGELWKYRVGDYRILCRLEDAKLKVLVVTIGHRREVYRA